MEVAWHDLLGIPWRLHGKDRSGMDCSTIAEEVLRRLGHTPPETSAYRQKESAGTNNEMVNYFKILAESYDKIGTDLSDAKQVGDLVLAEDNNGVARHLFVRVEAKRSTFLTATHNSGVVAVRPYLIKNIGGVYRIKGGAK